MAVDQQELKMLYELKTALLNNDSAKKEYEAAYRTYKDLPEEVSLGSSHRVPLKYRLPYPPPKESFTHRNQAREEYKAPFKEEHERRKRNKKIVKRTILYSLIIMIGLAILSLCVLLFTKIFAVCSHLSFNKFTGEDGDVYVSLLFMVIAVVGYCIAAISSITKRSLVVTSISFVGAIVCCIISLIMYWSVVDSFKRFLGAIVGLFILIPDFFKTLAAILLFLVGLVLCVIPVVAVIWLCIMVTDNISDGSAYTGLTKDQEEEFRASDQYKKALRLDEIATQEIINTYPQRLEAYQAECARIQEAYQRYRENYKKYVESCGQLSSHYDYSIRSASSYLHTSQINVPTIDKILYYMTVRHTADSITDAFVRMREDEFRQELLQRRDQEIQQLKKRMDEQSQEYIAEINKLNEITKLQEKQLKAMENIEEEVNHFRRYGY